MKPPRNSPAIPIAIITPANAIRLGLATRIDLVTTPC
jgi:hypothetical protein